MLAPCHLHAAILIHLKIDVQEADLIFSKVENTVNAVAVGAGQRQGIAQLTRYASAADRPKLALGKCRALHILAKIVRMLNVVKASLMHNNAYCRVTDPQTLDGALTDLFGK